MGASAVLLFAVPASPLAQFWSIIGGNTISALAGISVGQLVHEPMAATGVAVSLAIVAMSMRLGAFTRREERLLSLRSLEAHQLPQRGSRSR